MQKCPPLSKGPRFLRSARVSISIEEQYFGYKEVKHRVRRVVTTRILLFHSSYILRAAHSTAEIGFLPRDCKSTRGLAVTFFTARFRMTRGLAVTFFIRPFLSLRKRERGRWVVPPCGGRGRGGVGWYHPLEEEGERGVNTMWRKRESRRGVVQPCGGRGRWGEVWSAVSLAVHCH